MHESAENARDKMLSACDECRARKLKCSGEHEGCSRCSSEGSTCHYSQKKTMGRPRKRRREEATTEHADGITTGSGGGGISAADAVHVGFEDLDPAVSSGNELGLGPDIFHFSEDSFQRHEIVAPGTGSRPSLSNVEASSLDLPGDPVSNLEEDFPDWDVSHDLGKIATNPIYAPTQLQTLPIAADELENNNQIAEGAVPSCTCLSDLYSTLGKFQSLPAPSFPYSMGALKSAAALSRCVVACRHCSKTFNTALQNSMLLGTLVQLLIMEYAKLLNHIDERSQQSEKIAFRLADPSTSLFDSRHTGLPDCPMAINIDFTGDEWRALARKAVAQEVFGDPEGSRGLTGLVQQMEERRVSWREQFSTEWCKSFGTVNHQHSAEHPDHLCAHIVYIKGLKRSLEALGL